MNVTTQRRVATLEQRVAVSKEKKPLIFRVMKEEEHTEKTWASCLLKSGRVYMAVGESYSSFVERCKNNED